MAVTIHTVKSKPARAEPEGQVLESLQPQRQPASAASSFEMLFAEHWSRLCGVLFRLTGDPAEAEDLALETFWRLYRRPPQDLNLAGWLYRVATRLGLNALRSHKRRRRYEEQAGILEEFQNASPDPAAEAERSEQRQTVRQALARMQPRSAQLLLLRHSGLSYAEVAAILGLAPSSVGALLARAEADFEKRYRALERR